MASDKIKKIYEFLLNLYGRQGWFPLIELHSYGVNPTKSGSINGYHPGDYSYPKNEKQKFEICVGLILTQNTSWVGAEKALVNLYDEKVLNPKGIDEVSEEKLKSCIKPAGYFNQKSKYLKEFVEFFNNIKDTPSREDLLNVKGVGKETADGMLLYAFKQPYFVVDAYTKRILTNLGIIDGGYKYEEIRKIFEDNLERDFRIYQEYHALLVEHAKRYYMKRENYGKDPLLSL